LDREDENITRGHGIPQGPLTSNLLAECFLHSLDNQMISLPNIRYLRYVGDIKIFAQDEKPLQSALVTLDLISKRLGLVPQPTKQRILEINHIGDFLRTDPSRLPDEPLMPILSHQPALRQRRLRRQFISCFTREGDLKCSSETSSPGGLPV
jgi:hypothetical protein